MKYDEFADRVRRLCRESPGAQSALRAGLGKPVTDVPARMHAALLRPGLIREDPERRGYADKERAYYAVAALIAARPRAQRLSQAPGGPDTGTAEDSLRDGAAPVVSSENGGDGTEPAALNTIPDAASAAFRPHGTSLGESFALAVGRRDPDQLKSGAAESRLHLLVRQDLDGAHRMLPSVFRWLGSSGVVPDYACLLHDLAAWRYGRDAISTRWLQEFYRSLRRQEAAAEQNSAPPGT
ncbi:type I-E CRISPR-associated protein Cse2/CasB [Actinacidiphila acididurans]|uniref:Type I-E CRISPR-associated protein Cse2/CasB n=1 Tax=Actinacidiphila acididurans TaxID=2784346 RepID=A0ABS2TXB7_9ACTN|nr:type I-E CRISPR-associated protein Cse2/CasB [Actinacidiphila acididurans]MBM9507988.1 type I-E CRISPR-associated protein Cse2/CasB [Actinacidiphila acididurans]